MDKRYQVFVSSTYADLKDERQRVIQSLMEMDCIPAGMELFPAMDDQQWDFIKRVIDDCNYYLLIIGGRYGSMTSEGISYTEKEFDYAFSAGMKIVALLHEDPDSLPVNKSDIDPAVRDKLNAFREKATTNRLVKFWKTAEELPGMVVLSLSKTIKTYPAVGWVRASSVASEEMLLEINELRKQNAEMRSQLSKVERQESSAALDLADFDSSITVTGETRISGTGHYADYTKSWKVEISWRKIFSLLSPYLLDHPADGSVKTILARVIADDAHVGGYSRTINDQQFKTITIQLKALGLVKVDYLKSTNGGMALFWSLTSAGERIMVNERVIKNNKG